MSIKNPNEDRLSWVDALKARLEPRDYETRYASTPESETIDGALEQTVEAVFSVPTGEETSEEAITRASKDISAEANKSAHKAMIDEIKAKLADRDDPIDPVSLGVEVKAFTQDGMERRPITQEEWDNATDPRFVENVAKLAVVAYEKKRSMAWQERAMDPKAAARRFDPEYSKDGRIMSAPAQSDDSAPRFGSIPKNANSIWDPERIQKLSEALMTDHDAQVEASREYYEKRSKKADAERAEKAGKSSPISQNTGSQLMRSGSAESEAFVQKVPRDQLSMLDVQSGDFKDLSQEEKKARLESIFMEKVPDAKEETRKANEERRQQIQGEKREDRSWDSVNNLKPLSTSDIQKRLIELWIPEDQEE